MFLKKKILTPQGTLVHSLKKNFLSSLKKPSFEHSQIQLVQITDYRKTESKNSNSMHYKHIHQQLTTCWPQNFKPQIKYIVKKKRKKKKNLEKYYIIITKNEWIVVLFLRQILYSFFWRGDIYDWRDLLKYCTGIPTTMGKNAKKKCILQLSPLCVNIFFLLK